MLLERPAVLRDGERRRIHTGNEGRVLTARRRCRPGPRRTPRRPRAGSAGGTRLRHRAGPMAGCRPHARRRRRPRIPPSRSPRQTASTARSSTSVTRTRSVMRRLRCSAADEAGMRPRAAARASATSGRTCATKTTAAVMPPVRNAAVAAVAAPVAPCDGDQREVEDEADDERHERADRRASPATRMPQAPRRRSSSRRSRCRRARARGTGVTLGRNESPKMSGSANGPTIIAAAAPITVSRKTRRNARSVRVARVRPPTSRR